MILDAFVRGCPSFRIDRKSTRVHSRSLLRSCSRCWMALLHLLLLCLFGRLDDRIEVKMMLSMPGTTSSTNNVINAAQEVGSASKVASGIAITCAVRATVEQVLV